MNAPARREGRGEAPTADELSAFVALSSWLTGFDVGEVAGPAVIAGRFALFTREAPATLRAALLEAWRRADHGDAESQRRAVTDDPRWAAWTRAHQVLVPGPLDLTRERRRDDHALGARAHVARARSAPARTRRPGAGPMVGAAPDGGAPGVRGDHVEA